MSPFIRKLKEEIIRAIPGIIFFILAFNFVVLTESLMMHHEMNMPVSYAEATIGGIIVGKLLIILNSFSFINAFPNKPLIYNMTWKFCLYGLASFIFRILDTTVKLFWKHSDGQIIWAHFSAAIVSPIFWSTQLWILGLFAVYVFITDLVQAVGRKRVVTMMFG